MATLFLDFDGVLHPNEAYLRTGGVVLLADGHALFEYADRLCEILAPYPTLRVVLSTSWVAALRSFKKAKGYLPPALQAQVVGATWHSGAGRVAGSTWHSSADRYEWNLLTRFEQIQRYVARHRLPDWLALDDDDIGWPDDQRHRLVCTHEWHGLGDEFAQSDLRAKLAVLMSREGGIYEVPY
ncbi:MAG: HAD domain-containing protein [Thiobacillus sp.]